MKANLRKIGNKLPQIFMVWFLLAPLVAFPDNTSFMLEDEVELNSGHIKLDWTSDSDNPFELQQATNADFSDARTIYQGYDKASFISGLNEGIYYFRIRQEGEKWGDQVKVVVKYQSLNLAFSLFSMGAIVFILTTIVIIRGTIKYQKVI